MKKDFNKTALKRFSAFLLAILLTFSLFYGCSSKPEEENPADLTTVERTEAKREETEALTEPEEEPETTEPSLSEEQEMTQLPSFTGDAYSVINENVPFFTAEDLTVTSYETYGALDAYGRCTKAVACCGQDLMPLPDEERGDISEILPSGWKQKKYPSVPGKYLYNRSHLIGWQLTAENANPKNLITGTYYMNNVGIAPFENMIADYIKETSNHVLYRVTPIFFGRELLARGVLLEALSVEDEGDGICFNVFCHNVQPGIKLDYLSGESELDETYVPDLPDGGDTVYITPTGKRYHLSPTCGGKNSYPTTLKNALAKGLTPCKKCVG